MSPQRRNQPSRNNMAKSKVMTRGAKSRLTNEKFNKLLISAKCPPKNKVMVEGFKTLVSRLQNIQNRYQSTISTLVNFIPGVNSNINISGHEPLSKAINDFNFPSMTSDLEIERNQSAKYGNGATAAENLSFCIFLKDYGPVDVPHEFRHKLDGLFQQNIVHFCCKCFRGFNSSLLLEDHCNVCVYDVTVNNAHRIYSECNTDIEVYVICGKYFNEFVVNLVKFASLFGKFLWDKLEHFDFFLLFQKSKRKLIGFFSRDKSHKYVMCVLMILPSFQKMGYGYFLVSLAYDIGKQQNICSAPVTPYTDGGGKTIIKYWRYAIGKCLKEKFDRMTYEQLTLQTISDCTHIPKKNISNVLMRKEVQIRGQHFVNPKTRYKFQTFISDADAIEKRLKVRFYSTCVDYKVLNAITCPPEEMVPGFTVRK